MYKNNKILGVEKGFFIFKFQKKHSKLFGNCFSKEQVIISYQINLFEKKKKKIICFNILNYPSKNTLSIFIQKVY